MNSEAILLQLSQQEEEAADDLNRAEDISSLYSALDALYPLPTGATRDSKVDG